MTNHKKISLKNIRTRNNIAISLTIILSIGTAFLGWLGAWGILMLYAFFFLSPMIALIVPKHQLHLSTLYVVLTFVIYWIGLVHWGYIGKDWLTGISGLGALNQIALFGLGLCFSMFTTLLVFLERYVK